MEANAPEDNDAVAPTAHLSTASEPTPTLLDAIRFSESGQPITRDKLDTVLATLYELADEGLVPSRINKDMYGKLYTFVYLACTQKAPNNFTEAIYGWWADSVPKLREAIERRFAEGSAPIEARDAACSSFDALVDKMAWILKYLDRFYVKRLKLPDVRSVACPEQAALRQALLAPLGTGGGSA